MKTIWFVYPYGGIPGEVTQDMRYIRFGKRLAREHKCVWWTANYSKGKIGFRSRGIEKRKVQDNLEVALVPTTAYYKNISFKRILFEINYARNLKKAWNKEDKPDLIITPGTGMLTAFRPVWQYVKHREVKMVYDIMDIHLINSYFKKRHFLLYPFVSLVMWISKRSEQGFYKSVDGVTGLGRNQLEVAKQRTGNRNIPTCLVYNGIDVDEFRDKMKQSCSIPLPEKKEGWIWCIYAGSLGPSYDIPTLIECAKRCEENKKRIEFIVAGTGDYAEKCKEVDLDNFIYLGYVAKQWLPSIYSKCDVGLCAFGDFSTVDMPDKFYDYTAAGMAIVNSLNGEVKELIESNKLGVQYKAGDPEDLYRKVYMLEDMSFLDECKRNSWRVGGDFDLKKQLDSLEELVERILI